MRRLASFAAGLAMLCTAMAIAASPALASATPAWWACEKTVPKHSGHYSDKGCTTAVESGGSHELQPGIGKGKAFKGKSTRTTLTIVIPFKIELQIDCAVVRESGHAALPNRVTGVTLAFSKCEIRNFGAQCSDFALGALAGELGWIDKEAGLVGVSLTDEASPGTGYMTQFECSGVAKFRVFGSFIGRRTGDIKQLSATAATTWEVGPLNAGPGHENEVVNYPRSFEAGPVEELLAELNSKESHESWVPEGGYRGGLEAVIPVKGETLMIQ
jgi:hypothetical protein